MLHGAKQVRLICCRMMRHYEAFDEELSLSSVESTSQASTWATSLSRRRLDSHHHTTKVCLIIKNTVMGQAARACSRFVPDLTGTMEVCSSYDELPLQRFPYDRERDATFRNS